MDEFARHRRLEATADRIVVERNGRRTIWRRWGEGEPLILVHGGSGSWAHWTRNIEALGIGRMVLVPDTPGFGESDAPEQANAPGIAASLIGDVDALIGPDTPAAAERGTSMGRTVKHDPLAEHLH